MAVYGDWLPRKKKIMLRSQNSNPDAEDISCIWLAESYATIAKDLLKLEKTDPMLAAEVAPYLLKEMIPELERVNVLKRISMLVEIQKVHPTFSHEIIDTLSSRFSFRRKNWNGFQTVIFLLFGVK